MARPIRFHLDECCDPAIADGLRRRSVDVTTSQEVGLLKAEDEEQATYGFFAYPPEKIYCRHDPFVTDGAERISPR
jgi:hypothetical protein